MFRIELILVVLSMLGCVRTFLYGCKSTEKLMSITGLANFSSLSFVLRLFEFIDSLTHFYICDIFASTLVHVIKQIECQPADLTVRETTFKRSTLTKVQAKHRWQRLLTVALHFIQLRHSTNTRIIDDQSSRWCQQIYFKPSNIAKWFHRTLKTHQKASSS